MDKKTTPEDDHNDEEIAAMWVCPRCGEVMESKDSAEGCEDWDCPAAGGEK